MKGATNRLLRISAVPNEHLGIFAADGEGRESRHKGV